MTIKTNKSSALSFLDDKRTYVEQSIFALKMGKSKNI